MNSQRWWLHGNSVGWYQRYKETVWRRLTLYMEIYLVQKGKACCLFRTLDSSSLQPTLPPLSSKPANCVWGSKRVSVPWTAPALGLPLTVPLPFFPSNTEELFIQHLVPQTFQHYPQCLCEWMQVCVADMVCTLSLLLVELHTAPYITTAAQDSCDGLEVRTCVCVLNCTHYNYDLVFFSLCQPF